MAMIKMADWFKGLKITLGVLFAVLMAGVTMGAALDGWLTLPGEVARLSTMHTTDSLITQQNQKDVTDLRAVTTALTTGQGTLLELVRTIDRRTCITAASNDADLAECAEL